MTHLTVISDLFTQTACTPCKAVTRKTKSSQYKLVQVPNVHISTRSNSFFKMLTKAFFFDPKASAYMGLTVSDESKFNLPWVVY